MRRLIHDVDKNEKFEREYTISNGKDPRLGSDKYPPIKIVNYDEIKDVYLTLVGKNLYMHNQYVGKTDYILTSVWVGGDLIHLNFTQLETLDPITYLIEYDENFKMEFEVEKPNGKPDRYRVTTYLSETTDHFSGVSTSQYRPIVTEWHDSEKRTLKFWKEWNYSGRGRWIEVSEVRL